MLDFSKLQEVFLSSNDLKDDVWHEVRRGSLRKIGSRLYTRNVSDSPEAIVSRNLWHLVAAYFPGALIADRTALENRPASDGSIFLISDHKRKIELPGVTLQPRPGHPPLDTDLPFISGLRICSRPRAYLENMRPSRARTSVARTLSPREVEHRLEETLRHSGENALQRIRDEAREIAPILGLEAEFRKLDNLIGTLLGTRSVALESPAAIARAAGQPYDPHRLGLFQRLFSELAGTAPITRLARATDGLALPFFEAYFSNFIEGTEFAVDEAAEIVFKGRIPAARPADAHDILGTWSIVSDRAEMSRRPRDFETLKSLLQSRHARIMEGRPDKAPGRFKLDLNRAGSTTFVAPQLVNGTLAQGFDMFQALTAPLHRAIFMMFLISEVHPFADGNGRIARVMMNAELVAEGENRIVVPTIYRNNYLTALKALSQNGLAAPLIRTMDFAQKFTGTVDFSNLEHARMILERCNAFFDPNEAEADGVRLMLPGPDILAEAR